MTAGKARGHQVRRMPDSAYFDDHRPLVGQKAAWLVISPIIGMLIVLAGGLWGTMVTCPVAVTPGMEQAARSEVLQLESVERLYAVRGGGVTVHLVGHNERGTLMIERLIIDPDTLALAGRADTLIGRDPYSSLVVTAWVSRLVVIAALAGMVRFLAVRNHRAHRAREGSAAPTGC